MHSRIPKSIHFFLDCEAFLVFPNTEPNIIMNYVIWNLSGLSKTIYFLKLDL